MRIKILDHPLVSHKISVLRDKNTPSPIFRQLVDELVTLLAYEATREIRVEEVEVVTPVATTTGVRIADPKPLVVPILRAGLGMLEGMTKLDIPHPAPFGLALGAALLLWQWWSRAPVAAGGP